MVTQKDIDNKRKELEELETKFKKQSLEFEKIKYKGKEFRIYKWENQPFKDFPMPEGFNLAEVSNVDELVNKKLLIPVNPLWYVFKQRYPKINKNYGLSWLYLSRDLNLGSGGENLANSVADGRVIVESIK